MSLMPRGSRPLVGSSRMSSRGAAHQRGGQAEPLPHAERVGADRPPVDARQADLLQGVVDAAAPGAPPPPGAGPAASSSRRLARPDRCGYAAGSSISAPISGRTRLTCRGTGSPEHRDRPARRVHQAEQHPDEGGLAAAVRAEQAVPVALADVEAHVADRLDVAEALRQVLCA